MSGPSPRAAHWDDTYDSRGATDVSWFQGEPTRSLELIDTLDMPADAAVIDIGGGASVLVDRLAERGVRDLTVLDISSVALDLARDRLGSPDRFGPGVTFDWIAADVTTWEPARTYDLWHDRAVFHFLTEPDDRDAYLRTLHAAVPHGAVVLATFAPDGPDTCSGLPVVRYGPDELADLLEGFGVVETRRELHRTPWDTEQPFTFVAARRES